MEIDELQSLMKDRKTSQEDVGREAGVSGSTVSRFLSGKSIATRNMKRLELWAKGQSFKPPTEDDDYDAVPLLEVKASAGNGAVVEGERIAGWLHFRREYLKTVGPVSQLRLIQVDGDSMEPTLRNGDTLMIHTGRIEVRGGKLYACAYQPGELLVKRLHPSPGGRIAVISDNPTYPRDEVDAGGLSVYGEVVWMARRLG
jgi:phage repressor protein C with HTH and peptisase S24 domain